MGKSNKSERIRKRKAAAETSRAGADLVDQTAGDPVGPVAGPEGLENLVPTVHGLTTVVNPEGETPMGNPANSDTSDPERVAESSTAARPSVPVLRNDGNNAVEHGTLPEVPTAVEMWKTLTAIQAQLAILTQPAVPAENLTVGQSTRICTAVPIRGSMAGATAEVVEVDPPPTRQGRKVDYLSLLEHISRLGTKHFVGSPDPIEADEWRSRLVRNFKSTRCPEDYKKDIAIHFLEGDAHNWWIAVEKRANKVHTFAEFEAEFNRKYFPSEAWDKLETKFLDLVQGDRTVREYEEEFNRLRRYVGGELVDEEVQVRRFLRGLRVELRTHCSVRTFGSVSELVERAAMVESSLDEEHLGKGKSRPILASKIVDKKRNRDHFEETNTATTKRSQCGTCGKRHGGECWKAKGSCAGCGSRDHSAQNCPRMDQGRNKASGEGTKSCYHCGKAGHFKRECPKLQVEMQMGQKGTRGGTEPEPQAKRQSIPARVYELSKDGEEAGNFRAITGKPLAHP